MPETVNKRGVDVLHDPRLNKGTAFTPAERDKLGLRGLLPPRYVPIEEQLERVYENYGYKESDLAKYIYLICSTAMKHSFTISWSVTSKR